jgi:hypothetical protein
MLWNWNRLATIARYRLLFFPLAKHRANGIRVEGGAEERREPCGGARGRRGGAGSRRCRGGPWRAASSLVAQESVAGEEEGGAGAEEEQKEGYANRYRRRHRRMSPSKKGAAARSVQRGRERGVRRGEGDRAAMATDEERERGAGEEEGAGEEGGRGSWSGEEERFHQYGGGGFSIVGGVAVVPRMPFRIGTSFQYQFQNHPNS